MITNKQRAFLRSKANGLESVFNIGKAGVSPELTASVDEALEARELIKLSVLDNCALSAKEAAQILSERTHSDVAQVIGSKFILYRRSSKKSVIELPK